MLHDIQLYPSSFDLLWNGHKRYLLHKVSDIKEGDWLLLREYKILGSMETGRYMKVSVHHILTNGEGLKQGWCIISISKPKRFKSIK